MTTSTKGHFIYIMNKATGAFVDRLDVAVIESELPHIRPTLSLVISGLTVQPAGGGELKTYWIADRGQFSPATLPTMGVCIVFIPVLWSYRTSRRCSIPQSGRRMGTKAQ